MTLEHKVAWVTGGGSGIGGRCHRTGPGRLRVVISGRDAAKLEARYAGRKPGARRRLHRYRTAGRGRRRRRRARGAGPPGAPGPRRHLVNSAGINFPKRYWNHTDSATFNRWSPST